MKQHVERIDLSDNMHSAVVKLAEGNPGAIVVMMGMVKDSPIIDPIGSMGGFGPLLNLDSLGIYGPRIWMLFKDVCDEDIGYTLAVLRCWQMGILSAEDLHNAIDNRGKGVNPDELVKQLSKVLESFNVNAAVS